MITRALNRTGLRGWHLHVASFGAVNLCIGLWIRAKTVDQMERGNAERRALFVGLWPPLLWMMGDALQLEERSPVRRRAQGLRRGGGRRGLNARLRGYKVKK